MSHQSGITASPDLLNLFSTAKVSNIRMMKVIIENEKLNCNTHANVVEDWEQDWDKCVVPAVEENLPCYILYRTDTPMSQGGFEWIYIVFSPDTASVKQKMLYAATRSTLKRQFGDSSISAEYLCTEIADCSFEGYQRFLKLQNVAAPLTAREEVMNELKKTEGKADIGVNTKHPTMKGVSFKISEGVQDGLTQFLTNQVSFLKLCINIPEEIIELEEMKNLTVNELSNEFPQSNARYFLFRYPHSHEGEYLKSTVFIHYVPDSGCPVKERMLYASVKSAFLDDIARGIGLEIEHKFETGDPQEVNEQFIYDTIHPKTTIVREMFSRPKGPSGRGPRRITTQKKE